MLLLLPVSAVALLGPLDAGWGEEEQGLWGSGSGAIESTAIRLWQQATRRHFVEGESEDQVRHWYRHMHKKLEHSMRGFIQSTRDAGLPTPAPRYLPIQRRRAEDLPRLQFQEEFALALKPVILEGLLDNITGGVKWDKEFFTKHCGDLEFELKKYQPQAKTWASQGTAKKIPLKEALAKIDEREKIALFDESLLRDCPEAISSFALPEQFAEDMIPQLPVWFSRHGAWPSLFASQQGAETGLHIDWGASQAWMLVLEGTKEFTFFHASQAPLLYQEWTPHGHGVYQAEGRPWLLDASKNPLVGAARGWRGNVKAGDVIFLPAMTHHAVRNLSPTLAIAVNYIDTVTMKVGLGGESFLDFGIEKQQLHKQWHDLLDKVDAGVGLAQFHFRGVLPFSRAADRRWLPLNATPATTVQALIDRGEFAPDILWLQTGVAKNKGTGVDGRYSRVYPANPGKPLWVNTKAKRVLFEIEPEDGGGWGVAATKDGTALPGASNQREWPTVCSAPLAHTGGGIVWPHEAGYWGSRKQGSSHLVIDWRLRVSAAEPAVTEDEQTEAPESSSGSAKSISFKDSDGDTVMLTAVRMEGRVKLLVNGQFLTWTSRLRWWRDMSLLQFEDVGLETKMSEPPNGTPERRTLLLKLLDLSSFASLEPPVQGLTEEVARVA